MKVGRRLAIKILNASRFVLSRLDGSRRRPGHRRPGLERTRRRPCWPASPAVVEEATAEFDAYDHARALEITESFFWSYCDDYLELVKTRAYGDPVRGRPGLGTPRTGTELVGRCCASSRPFLPYCTEEAWSWWQYGLDPPAPVALGLSAGGCGVAPRRGPELLGGRSAAVLVAAPAGQDRGEGLDAHPGRPLRRDGPAVARSSSSSSPRAIWRDAGVISQLELVADPMATALSVTVELATRTRQSRLSAASAPRLRARTGRRQ